MKWGDGINQKHLCTAREQQQQCGGGLGMGRGRGRVEVGKGRESGDNCNSLNNEKKKSSKNMLWTKKASWEDILDG